jgi:hypothetical protein
MYVGGSDIILNPNSTASLRINNPPDEWFTASPSGLFKEEIRDGRLTLNYRKQGSQPDSYWPVKTIPFKAHLNYWSEQERNNWGTTILFIALALGGICSLILSYWVPNRSKLLNLKEQLDNLAKKTSEISDRIDSSLRVAIRVERKRLLNLLSSRWVFSPDITDVFNQCSKGIATLTKRIELLEEVDRGYGRLERRQNSAQIPPSQIEQIEKVFEAAVRSVTKTEPLEADTQKARELIDQAHDLMDKFGMPDKKFAQKLAGLLGELVTKFNANGIVGGTALCQQIRDSVPRPFNVLDNPLTDPKKIKPDKYFWLDTSISQLGCIEHYVYSHESMTQQADRDKLNKYADRLLENLNRRTWSSLRIARLLAQQMEEAIYRDDVENAIKACPPEVSIEMNPPVARANQPVQFGVKFHRDELNHCAARDEFKCKWIFGHDDLEEEGWDVSHYFPKAKKYQIQIVFEDFTGLTITDSQANPSTVSKKITVRSEREKKRKDRIVIEVIRLGIALGVTALGLMAGAREQIAKLDFIAGLIVVFMLGFGADRIKNLLTQAPGQKG